MIIYQIDVKIAFLNGELKEEIYMNQLDGFITKGRENKIYKLVKSFYMGWNKHQTIASEIQQGHCTFQSHYQWTW